MLRRGQRLSPTVLAEPVPGNIRQLVYRFCNGLFTLK